MRTPTDFEKQFGRANSVRRCLEMARCNLSLARYTARERNAMAPLGNAACLPHRAKRALEQAKKEMRRETRNLALSAFAEMLRALVLMRCGGRLS